MAGVFFVLKVMKILKRLTYARSSSLSVCLSVCLSVASHISETSEAIAFYFDTVTASVTRMHHVLIILTLAFIQGHTGVKIMKIINVRLL